MRMRGFGDADGAVIAHAGRYARECVLVAFEMIGGVDRLAKWAEEHPTEFYTRLYTKVITREVEVSASAGIEELLAQLDKGVHSDSSTEHEILDAEIIDE